MKDSAAFTVLDSIYVPKDLVAKQYDPQAIAKCGALSIPDEAGMSVLLDAKSIDSRIDPNQFYLYQMEQDGSISPPGKVKPSLDGKPEAPDVRMDISLDSFHIGTDVQIAEDTRATLRIRVGNDEDSPTNFSDQVFWYVAAGLNLWNESKKRKADYAENKANISSSLRASPIVLPGGLATLKVDVIHHKETPWWKKIFTFLSGPTGMALSSTLGFPGLVYPAVKLLDSLLDDVLANGGKILFGGDYVRYCLTAEAKRQIEQGGGNTSAGSIKEGRLVLVRGTNSRQLSATKTQYHWSNGILAPADMDIAKILSGEEKNPLDAITYAVLRVNMKAVKWEDFLKTR